MTDDPVLVRAAYTIAENAVLAFERDRDGAWFHETGRQSAIKALTQELLSVMPNDDGYELAAACNRGLDLSVPFPGPRVLVVSLDDGSVTMR